MEDKRMEMPPPEELGGWLMGLSARKRLEAILRRPDAGAVTAALPEQDFFFTVKEVGPDDALPLLALARTQQITHLFDMEWWRKDRFLPVKAAEWLDRLARAGEGKLEEWLYEVDFALLVTLFKKWTRVAIASEDLDPLEAEDRLPMNTLDDRYYWDCVYPECDELIKYILGMLFELNSDFYTELMNHVIWSVDVESEEQAQQFRRGRLEDLAIPDFYDALEIQRAIRPGEITRGKTTTPFSGEETPPAPSFALALAPEGSLLRRAMGRIADPQALGCIQVELASIANKIVVADRLSLDDRETLRQAVDKATAHLNLGLDLLAKDDAALAASLLLDAFLEHLYRLGWTQVARLRGRFQRLAREGWLSRWPAGVNILDGQWMDAADLMLQRTPKLLRPRKELSLPPGEDYFRDRRDLHRASGLIGALEALGPVYDSLGVRPEELEDNLWAEGQLRSLKDATLGALLWTAAARMRLFGEWRAAPLPVEAWPDIFARLAPQGMTETIRAKVEEIAPDPAVRTSIGAYLNPLFKAYAEEMGRGGEGAPPTDPRLTRFFLFMGE
jgi:hypothetical protein